MKSWSYICQLPETSGDNDLNFVGFLLKACGTQNVILHLIDILSNFSHQILLICLIELATDVITELKMQKTKMCSGIFSTVCVLRALVSGSMHHNYQ